VNSNQLLEEYGIIETYIPSSEKTTSKNDKTWLKYTFPNGEEIILQFGPICMLEQIDYFEKRRDKILLTKLKWMKIQKIKKLINDSTK